MASMTMAKPQGVQGVSLAPGSIIQIGEKDGWRTANGPDAGTFTPYTEQECQAIQCCADGAMSAPIYGDGSGEALPGVEGDGYAMGG